MSIKTIISNILSTTVATRVNTVVLKLKAKTIVFSGIGDDENEIFKRELFKRSPHRNPSLYNDEEKLKLLKEWKKTKTNDEN